MAKASQHTRTDTHTSLKHASPSVYITARGNMMLGVKLFIDPFIACPRLLVVVSCLGLCVNVCPLERALRGERQP